MDKDDFKEWLEHPITEKFKKYLKDSAKEESSIVADAILNGDVIPQEDQIRISTLAMTLVQISEIGLDEIEGFYKK